MELNECVDNLEKMNRLGAIRTILSSIASYASTIEDKMSIEDDYENIINDSVMSKVVQRIKYDLETLERYL